MWEIGILRGDTPFEWTDRGAGRNPILTAADITDVPTEFVADPFMLRSGLLWYLFFEVLPVKSQRGEIGLAISRDTVTWEYQRIVLREPFHLSYPSVFRWEGNYYMTPETLGADEVRLYRSRKFPFDWEFLHRLIPGQHADPSIFRHDDRWWLLTCDTPRKHWSLRLYSAAELAGPWEEHPASPVVANDKSQARPAGRVLSHQGNLVRFAQNCVAQYGDHVRAFEITDLSRERYQERPASPEPVLAPTAREPWPTLRMHHLDAHREADDRWVACVDGWGAARSTS
jgi:hypothetical protein